MGEVVITVTEDGPYRVEGEFELVDQDGAVIESRSTNVFLCRCGRSQDKPFCDGTHGKVGFVCDRQARDLPPVAPPSPS